MFHPSINSISSICLDEVRQHVFDKGFCSLNQFVTDNWVQALEQEVNSLIEKEHTPAPVFGKVVDTENNVLVLNYIDKVSDMLYDFARHDQMIKIAEHILGKAVVPLHVEYFSKPANSIHETPPHQDHVFYHDHFHDELAISFWIALDDVTSKSGALEYLPSSSTSLVPHASSDTIDFDFEIAGPGNPSGYVQVPIGKGGCIIHHSYVVHKTGKNLTGSARRAIVFNYRGSPFRTYMRQK